MQTISNELLGEVHGGAEVPGSGGGGIGAPSSTSTPKFASDSLGMGGTITGAPGQQFMETNRSGPSGIERVNKSFDNSTKLMRSFNDTFGAFTQAPGFGNGDAMKP